MNWNHSTAAYRGAVLASIGGKWYAATLMPLEGNTWYHLAGTYDGTAIKAYRDGVLITSTPASGSPTAAVATRELQLGGAGTGQRFKGTIDDARVYRRALTEEEIRKIMKAGPAVQAAAPSPADGATDEPRDVVLGWTPGELAARHDVYLGTSFDLVNGATAATAAAGVYKGRQTLNAYATTLLELGQTYYWRVDEVNDLHPGSPCKGNVWSFEVEPVAYPIKNIIATASSVNSEGEGPQNTVNGSGLDASGLHSTANADMWLSSVTGGQPTWIRYDFDRVYTLHQVWLWNHNSLLEQVFGLGVKEATIEYSTDGTNWTTLGTTQEFARAPGGPGYAHNTVIDFGGVAAKYVKITANRNWGGVVTQYGLSEVRFLYLPMQAREPSPASGATGIGVGGVTLAWRSGREAAQHQVYLSTDEQAVIDETVSPINVPAGGSYAGYDAGKLELNKTYYWKVNERGAGDHPATWRGEVWSFTTQGYLVVDDFETYNDTDNKIFDVWVDYFVNGTGATLGHFDAPFAERTIVHSGSQSMPYRYDNDGTVNEGTTYEKVGTKLYAEAEREWATPQDWTTNGAAVLTLWFRGLPPAYGSFTAGPPMTMAARGGGIIGTADQFHFAFKPFSGDASITTKVVSLTDTGTAARVGVMIRESMAPDALHAMVAVTPTSGIALISRTTAGGASATATTQANVAVPQWIRLTRSGRNFTAEYSGNGTTWTPLGTPVTIAMSSDAYIGLGLTSGNVAATGMAEFSNVTTTGSVTGSWQSQDIGIPSNTAAPLYVALQDSANHSAIVKYEDPAATTIDTWTEWNIPLAALAGVKPSAVRKIAIGVGDRTNLQAAGSGTMYFDDIRLCPSKAPPQDPYLLAHYKLDGDARDSSGNNSPGTVQGNPQWVDGVIGGALQLDGVDDGVGTGNTEHLVNWTVACWVTSPATPMLGPSAGPLNRQGNYQVNWTHATEAYWGAALVQVGGKWYAAKFQPVAANTWYHIAATYDGSTLKAYRNGVSITSTPVSGTPTAATRELQLGKAGTAYFKGTIDDVRVYRRALTEAEVASLAAVTTDAP